MGLGASRGLGFNGAAPSPMGENEAQQDEPEDGKQRLVEQLDEVELRAASSSTVLRCFGRALREKPINLTADDAQALYAQSRKVQKIDYFLSHSWQSSGIEKYFALLLFLYRGRAIFLGLAAAAGMFAYQSRVHRFPAQCVHDVLGGYPYCQSWVELLVGSVITWLVMLLSTMLPGSNVFLDSLCVHQSDAALKAKGVWNIPFTVRLAEHFLVAYDEEYFQRGWCIYELAIKVSTTPKSELTSRLHFLPLNAYFTVAGLHVFWLFGTMLFFLIYPALMQVTALALTLSLASGLVPALAEAFVGQKLEEQKQILVRQLSNFEVQSAKFSMDSDRVAILERIKTMFGDLETFNELVRNDVRDVATASFSQQPATLPYGLVFFCNFPVALLMVAQASSFCRANAPTRVATYIEGMIWPLFIAPLATALAMYIGRSSSACIPLRTACAIITFMELTTHAVYTVPLLIAEGRFFFFAWNPWLGSVICAVLGAALAGMTLTIYLPRGLPQSQETDDTDGPIVE
eukprot:TRINITY_DN10149_c0_g2_i1.p1 TRINITY_DN10149_c0_g2~~TRINITY_DN10149_c0_g2_i1.p1  ORF type:complete len:541 (+),score=71.69 TRINITY_DN10149_c0_g2_i1:75-1625(+)